MIKTFLILLILSPFIHYSQSKIFNNWVFGKNAGITFNTNPPSFISNCIINSTEACDAISDENGQLLFYSDGVTVRNKNNTLMPNGSGLLGHNSATQGAFIIPNPKFTNIYYLFVMDREDGVFGGCACLSYSTIDMNLQNGLGDVISKNVLLYNHVTEKLAAFKQANDTSFWLIGHEYESNKFLSFSINSTGVNLTPVISSVGSSICCDPTKYNVIGQMKISPNCKKLGLCSSSNGKIELFDVDHLSGQVTNPISITSPNLYVYGLEFSPNSKIIYTTANYAGNSYLWQYDISHFDEQSITNSLQQIYYTNTYGFGQLQLAPNNKIYLGNYDEQHISAINNPNVLGWQCNFNLTEFYLYDNVSFGRSYFGLPNRIINCTDIDDNDTLCELIIPNIITPNNDGVNDNFKVQCYKNSITPDNLVLYNRWGKEVYSNSKQQNFDTFTDGTYYYLFYLYGNRYKGFVTVLK